MAAERGWTVLEPIYRENDTSASTKFRTRRPVFEQLLADAESGAVGVLLAYSTSRLTRRPLEYERLISLSARTGLEIQTVVSGPVQLDTADGRAIARVLAVIDAAEAERTSERVTRAKLQRAEQGLWHGGRPPFGYRYVPAERGLALEVEQGQAALVREAFRRVRRGDSLSGVARDWNKRGLRSPTGVLWRSQGVRKMLTMPAVAGLTERRGTLYQWVWRAILTRSQWDAVRPVLLDAARNSRSFRQIAKRYPLGGLLWCGLCGRQLVSNPLRTVPSFICSPTGRGGCGKIRVHGEHLERYLLELVHERNPAAVEGPASTRVRTAPAPVAGRSLRRPDRPSRLPPPVTTPAHCPQGATRHPPPRRLDPTQGSPPWWCMGRASARVEAPREGLPRVPDATARPGQLLLELRPGPRHDSATSGAPTLTDFSHLPKPPPLSARDK